jgi:hypothetical protein
MAAVALLGSVAAVTLAGASGAAPVLAVQSTTTSVVGTPAEVVTAEPGNPGYVAEPTSLVATVTASPIGGLLVTPGGKVTFTAKDAYGATIALGSKSVGVCLLTLLKCTATLSTNAFYVAPQDTTAGGTTWTVTASYPGDTVTTGSSGQTKITALTGSTQECSVAGGCFVSAENGDDTAFISLNIECTTACSDIESVMKPAEAPRETANLSNAANASYVAEAGFGAPTMASCLGGNDPTDTAGVSTNGYVEWPAADVTASDPAYVEYQLYGATADAQDALSDPSSICYSQLAPFTQADGSPAVFDAALNQYEGVPAACSSNGGAFPCSQPWSYQAAEDDNPSVYSITVETDTDPGTGRH